MIVAVTTSNIIIGFVKDKTRLKLVTDIKRLKLVTFPNAHLQVRGVVFRRVLRVGVAVAVFDVFVELVEESRSHGLLWRG